MIAAALRRAVQRLMSSGGWFIEALLSGCNSAWGYPPQAPASCRQLDRARCCLATLESTLSRGFRAYWLSNFRGGRSRNSPLLNKDEIHCMSENHRVFLSSFAPRTSHGPAGEENP